MLLIFPVQKSTPIAVSNLLPMKLTAYNQVSFLLDPDSPECGGHRLFADQIS
jgi:hypothetical protein